MRLAVIGLFLAAQASAQPARDSWPVGAAPESRVRVTAPRSSVPQAVGRVHHWTPDSLVIQLDPSQAAAPAMASFHRTSITRLETSEGLKGHTVRGAFLGFLVGSVAGFFVAEAVLDEDADPYGTSFDGGAVVAVWAGTTVLTTVLGGIIGGAEKSERWKDVGGF
ncbi:MAG TPA: hypothetical protein VFR25_00090 [Candidatus Eisenbacteria bacterium]|nr:hypothetical protein [Candidatus Eisenbacteria bacterium]